MSETPEFKSRRARGDAPVEEARQVRESAGLDADPIIEALRAGATVTIHLGPIPPRHPATSIGE